MALYVLKTPLVLDILCKEAIKNGMKGGHVSMAQDCCTGRLGSNLGWKALFVVKPFSVSLPEK